MHTALKCEDENKPKGENKIFYFQSIVYFVENSVTLQEIQSNQQGGAQHISVGKAKVWKQELKKQCMNLLIAFERSLPTGFWKAIEKNVKTPERYVDFKDVLSYKLLPIPTALFDDSKVM